MEAPQELLVQAVQAVAVLAQRVQPPTELLELSTLVVVAVGVVKGQEQAETAAPA